MHRYGLAMSARAHLRAVVMWSMMVVAARDHFATFDEDGAEGKAHRALGSRIGTLREVKLGLVHDDGLGCVMSWSALRFVKQSTRLRLFSYMTHENG